ncbi:MAG: tRNA (N6-threonylcarbamoyladenosine(37)-N6)-methyltransferase TrmO [Anaerolineales bacterium]|nr:tRNA (N6-threonylcarbamoyladenosine(37)-N6)-methyltransferase TrmO [Anaerolineales bacterium]
MRLNPIGVIHSPYKERVDAPRQGRLCENELTLEVFPQFTDGLKGIKRASHLIILYWGDRAKRYTLQSPTPFSKIPVGVFASRSPNRPNPIAFYVANLVRHEGNLLIVRGVDALDGSPLLDIKAYSPALDSYPHATHANQSSDSGE